MDRSEKTCFWKTANSQTKTKTLRSILILKRSLSLACVLISTAGWNFYYNFYNSCLSYLPPFCALSRELSKDDWLFRMLLFMLLATCLYEESVRCHPSARLSVSTFTPSHLHRYLIILICILCVGLILDREEEKETLLKIIVHINGGQ